MIEPIYIYRPLKDPRPLYLYAESLGLENLANDLHATLAYSSDPVEWDGGFFDAKALDPTGLTVDGGNRSIQRFGDAIVLEFESRAFVQRWASFIMNGASWDFPEYRPHITLAYDENGSVDISNMVATDMPLSFDREFREMARRRPE